MDLLRRMAIFARVVELGAFNRAARELGLTTSSVSQHIRALETTLGVTLLHRSTRKLNPTDAGRIYYEECANMVHAAERAQQKVFALRDELIGELRLAAPAELAHRHLVPALREFILAHPGLSIRFELSDEKVDLIGQRIDLAVRIGELQDSRLVARKIAWFDEVICATPGYLKTVTLPETPQSLVEMDWLIFTPLGEPSFLSLRHRDGREVRLRVRGRLVTNLAQTLKALLMEEHGIARMLRVDVEKELERGELIELVPDWTLPGFGVYAITPSREPQPIKVSRCIDRLRMHFESLQVTA
jgi:DNA-binding transcriptional LysR family regulator